LQRTCIFQAERICLDLQGTCVGTGSYLILHWTTNEVNKERSPCTYKPNWWVGPQIICSSF
jgi:hypothetical protein